MLLVECERSDIIMQMKMRQIYTKFKRNIKEIVEVVDIFIVIVNEWRHGAN